jgi:hypothetical protein
MSGLLRVKASARKITAVARKMICQGQGIRFRAMILGNF